MVFSSPSLLVLQDLTDLIKPLKEGIALSTEGNIRSINSRANGTKYTVFETGSVFPVTLWFGDSLSTLRGETVK